MSRIGREPVKIEDGVTVEKEGKELTFKGPLGELKLNLLREIDVEIKDGEITVTKTKDNKRVNSLYGTYRSLINNCVIGVTKGYEKKLEVSGVGYRVKMNGEKLEMSLGWNHPVFVEPPEGIKFETPDEVTIIVKGHDKQLVGEVTARIREYRKTEPYKGKGIKYEGEMVRRKSVKKAVA
jgi:large subunit ribosomal protein L6